VLSVDLGLEGWPHLSSSPLAEAPMSGFRLTLASSLGIVAVVALGLTGLKSASTFWTSAAATLTLALFLAAVLGAWLLRRREQAACLGFALFGIVYLILVNWDWVGAQFGHDLTAGLGDLADELVPSPLTASRANPAGTPLPTFNPEDMAARQVRVGNFLQISRMVLALLFGLAGAYTAIFLVRRQDDARST
jgi:hypothetical protein